MPDSSFINVDLPAPFSPTRASTSPRRSVRCMSCSALTPGKLLATPRTSNSGTPVGSGASVVAGWVIARSFGCGKTIADGMPLNRFGQRRARRRRSYCHQLVVFQRPPHLVGNLSGHPLRVLPHLVRPTTTDDDADHRRIMECELDGCGGQLDLELGTYRCDPANPSE